MRRGSWAVHQSTKTESDVLTVPFNLQPFHVFNNHPRRGGAAVARVPAAAEEVASPPAIGKSAPFSLISLLSSIMSGNQGLSGSVMLWRDLIVLDGW